MISQGQGQILLIFVFLFLGNCKRGKKNHFFQEHVILTSEKKILQDNVNPDTLKSANRLTWWQQLLI